ncbi:MAG: Glycerol-phosphate dehydrogenase [Paenibacillus sp.]|nr:Glycerol-phosphate dehydrogenase [Paenibacillus sp.]
MEGNLLDLDYPTSTKRGVYLYMIERRSITTVTAESVLQSDVERLTGIEFACTCGRTHRVEIERLILEQGALRKVPDTIRQMGLGTKALLIADPASFVAAGDELAGQLGRSGFDVTLCVFPEDQLYADETALVRALIELEKDTEFMIAVGSGTINDIARFVSCKAGIPYLVVATAPSMDGYASTGSPILVNGYKKTYSLQSPLAIIGDLDVIRCAPPAMIGAGIGDMAAKITALCDWLLAAVVEEEHYCEVTAELMTRALTNVASEVTAIRTGGVPGIKKLMEGLVLSGIAMQMIGNSRPASGAEHHISHYWEMLHFAAGHRPELHGIKVGAATPLIARLYAELLEADMGEWNMTEKDAAQIAEWETNLRRCYGPLAEDMIAENRSLLLSQPELDVRMNRLVRGWPELKPKLRTLLGLVPDLKALLRDAGAPAEPREIGVARQELSDALRVAKEVRSRYTVLQLADQLGLLERFAEERTRESFAP